MDGRDADERRGEFDFEDASIHMGQPLRLIRVPLELQPGDERFVSSNDDHDQEIRDHDDINQSKDAQHHDGFGVFHIARNGGRRDMS